MLVGVIFIRRSLIIYLVGLQWVWSESYEILAIIIERIDDVLNTNSALVV